MSLTLNNGPNQAFAYERLADLTTVVGGTATVFDPVAAPQPFDGNAFVPSVHPVEAMITVETAPVRYRVDGADATTSAGHLVQAGEVIALVGYQHIVNFRVINAVASNGAAVSITYFR